MELRTECQADLAAIRDVITAAFAGARHRSGTEAAIMDGLRNAGALTISLVAEIDGELVGVVAFSSVRITNAAAGWYGLGPVAVRPDSQFSGIGQRLITEGLERLRGSGASGCVVLGDPAYYGRFGFQSDPLLVYPDVPAEDFQRLSFDTTSPAGIVSYHEAFSAN